MPLPNPSSFTNKDEYIGVCMSKQKGETREQDQKLAICFSKWERKNESNIIEKIDRFIGDQTTTAGVAVNTSGHGYPVKRKKKKKKDYKIAENGCPEGTYWCKESKKCVNESAGSPKQGDRFEDKKGKKLTVVSVGSGKIAQAGDRIEVKIDGEKHTRDIPMKRFFAPGAYKLIKEETKYVYVVKKGKEFKVPNDPKVIKKYKDKGFEIKEAYMSIDPYGKPFNQAGGNPAGQLKKRKLKGYELFSDINNKLAQKKAKEYAKKNKIKKYKIKVESPGTVSLTFNESIYGATLTSTGIQGSGQTRAVGDMNQEVMNLKKPVKFNNKTGTFSPLEDFLDMINIAEISKKQLSMLSGKVASQDKKAATYKKGQTVKHWKWGKGKIIDVGSSSFADQMLLTVKFPTGVMKRLPAHEFE